MTDFRRPGTQREQIERASRGFDIDLEDELPGEPTGGFPPPVIESVRQAPRREQLSMSDIPIDRLFSKLWKKLAPLVAIGTAVATGAGYLIAAGRRSAEVPTRDEVRAVASADDAVHRDIEKRLEQIDIRLESLTANAKAEEEWRKELKADLKELRAQATARGR